MSSPITPISNIPLPDKAGSQPGASPSGVFQSVLEKTLGGVEQARNEANTAVEKFLTGESEELHTTVMATEQAELSFELFLQTRNKVVQAYQEIMRMQM
ncbi:MAG: flagellar hook-basal body complex protein FliE [Acidobacteria bacterium]|nr:flagellar hook-basal body complex protein FliE [Acidobacteriota bacterium]